MALEFARLAPEQPAAKDAIGPGWLGEPLSIGHDREAAYLAVEIVYDRPE